MTREEMLRMLMRLTEACEGTTETSEVRRTEVEEEPADSVQAVSEEECPEEEAPSASTYMAGIVTQALGQYAVPDMSYDEVLARGSSVKSVLVADDEDIVEEFKAGNCRAMAFEIPDEMAGEVGDLLIKIGNSLKS